MDEKDILLLDKYFNGLLSAAEQQAVLDRAAVDPDFAEELELRKQMEDWPRRQAARQALNGNLSAIGMEFFESPAAEERTPPMKATTVNWRRLLLAAASVALLAAAVWFFSTPEPSLYSQYARYAPLALTERGEANTAATAAENAFNAGRYAEALTALDRLLAEQPDNSGARLYRGLCLLEMKRPTDARAALEPLAQGQSALRADAVWYSALSYLLENKQEGCKQTLSGLTLGEEHYEQAQELLKKLK